MRSETLSNCGGIYLWKFFMVLVYSKHLHLEVPFISLELLNFKRNPLLTELNIICRDLYVI